FFNSIDTGSFQPSLQAKDGGRPNITVKFPPLSISMIGFAPAVRAFFLRVALPEGFGEQGRMFLEFGECQLSLRFLRGEVNLPYLKEKLRRPVF
ncbi:hypothetical protein AVEN_184174-1, partial [Araneus ventricosus]